MSLSAALRGKCRALAVLVATGIVRAHAEPADPHLWLEQTESKKALAWVRRKNADTVRTS